MFGPQIYFWVIIPAELVFAKLATYLIRGRVAGIYFVVISSGAPVFAFERKYEVGVEKSGTRTKNNLHST